MQDSFILVEQEEEQEEEFDGNEQNQNLIKSVLKYFNEEKEFNFDYLNEINKNRSLRSDNKLFIDELLSLIPIESNKFPPTNFKNLKELIIELINSDNPFNYCIILYLLLSSLRNSNPTIINNSNNLKIKEFIKEFLLPLDFIYSIIGMELLDSNKFKLSISYLIDSRILLQDFINKILIILSTLTNLKERSNLILNFIKLSNINLLEEENINLILDALCDSNRKFGVTEAMKKQRNCKNLEVRERMLIRILSNCFGDNPTSLPIPHHLQTLLSHPLETFEDNLITTYCLSPPSSSNLTTRQISLIADWRISKLISEVRSVEAIEFGRKISRKGLKFGEEGRIRLLKAVRETLTDVQKSQVDLEAEESDLVSSGSNSTKTTTSTNRNSSSQSESQLLNPAWQARLPPSPIPIPSSSSQRPQYLTLSKPTPTPILSEPSPSSLPLSASPFLRREKPLVSSRDGTLLGGASKNILRALREGQQSSSSSSSSNLGNEKSSNGARQQLFPSFTSNSSSIGAASSSFSTTSPNKFREIYQIANHTSTPRGGSSTINNEQDNSKALSSNTPIRPTLSGFGSIRTTSLTQLSHSPAAPIPSTSTNQQQAQEESTNRMLNPSSNNINQDSPSQFSKRITLDPNIATTLIAATVANANSPSPTSTSTKNKRAGSKLNPNTSTSTTTSSSSNKGLKRRTNSSNNKLKSLSSQESSDGESFNKKRAISEEIELRPSSSIGSRNRNRNLYPPGAFPTSNSNSNSHEDQEEEQEQDEQPEKEVEKTTTTLKRRTTRASSLQPPSTPIATATPRLKSKKSDSNSSTAGGGGGLETPRRSSRLTTPARDLMNMTTSVGEESSRKGTPATGGAGGTGRKKSMK